MVTPFAPASGKFVALQHHQKLCFCNLSATQRRCKNILTDRAMNFRRNLPTPAGTSPEKTPALESILIRRNAFSSTEKRQGSPHLPCLYFLLYFCSGETRCYRRVGCIRHRLFKKQLQTPSYAETRNRMMAPFHSGRSQSSSETLPAEAHLQIAPCQNLSALVFFLATATSQAPGCC